MGELLFLLLPIAFYSGWYCCSKYYKTLSKNKSNKLNPEYIKGLNYVLNEQSDKALDLFLQIIDIDSETIETHLALANLYRKRGEVDLAIKIHQSLLSRSSLDRENRYLSMLELAIDYISAGVLDRAEELLKDLIGYKKLLPQSYTYLMDIYLKSKEWGRCIEIAKALEKVTGKSKAKIIAQFYCELLEYNLTKGDLDKAKLYLNKALSVNNNCPRANILQANLLKAQGKYKAAIKAYTMAVGKNNSYFPEVLQDIIVCFKKLNDFNGLKNYLKKSLDNNPTINTILSYTDLISEQSGINKALDFLKLEVKSRPSLNGLKKVIELSIPKLSESLKEDGILLKDSLNKLISEKINYKCSNCGFASRVLRWCCPGCKKWETVLPIAPNN